MNQQQPGVMQADPRSVVLLAAPASLFTAIALFLPFHVGRNDLEPFLTPFLWYWPCLIVNGLLALVVGAATTYVIKHCGAVGFLLVGMLNRILIAAATSVSIHGLHLIFHSYYGHLQLCGTLLAMSGIGHYCLMQANIESLAPGSRTYRLVSGYRGLFESAHSDEGTDYSTDEAAVSERQRLVDQA
jgi:hypothetical protein